MRKEYPRKIGKDLERKARRKEVATMNGCKVTEKKGVECCCHSTELPGLCIT